MRVRNFSAGTGAPTTAGAGVTNNVPPGALATTAVGVRDTGNLPTGTRTTSTVYASETYTVFFTDTEETGAGSLVLHAVRAAN